ncbi:MAG: polysaccharide lyase 8 family protein [Prolixibacteraceae bacterium]|nr:polysaccharide lyase 8 family protein [Prolixibacteraceae bacterium]
MNRFFLLALLSWLTVSTSIFAQPKADYPADLTQLHKNILDELLSGNSVSDTLQALVDRMDERGAWANIPYQSKQRGSWEPALHISYLQTMAKAWQKPGSDFYNNPKLLAKIHLALNYWLDNDFQCPNWWYPEIGVPMQLAPVLILMEEQLSPEQMAKGIKILDRAKIGMTGQNKVWQSGNVLLKSLLLRDDATIRKAAQSIQEEMKVSLGEGIQPDGSFHQHGPQIQFGNYGLSFVNDMIKWIRLLRNTPFFFDESKMSILRDYLLEGQQWITWKNQMDISACGRQLFVNAQTGKARNLAGAFSQMEKLDPAYAVTYQKAGNYETLKGNRHFWRSDFQVQRTPDYYFSVKMCSERVIGAESCNSENIRGYYLGDGATYLYQTGKEYENIFPHWDWKKIPGTTTHQDDKELPVLTASGYRIASNFVGGVSDGKTGIAVMDYNRDGIAAKKAWFIFNNQIVCLGAGITSSTGIPVTTSVNQSFLKGAVLAKTKTEKSVPAESSETITPKWILHDQAGYYFPDGGNLKLETKTVTGSWNRVASMYKDEPIQSGIFKLWFEHGTNPSGGTYAYSIIPQATKAQMQKLETKPSFRIVKNENNIQAVISSNQQWGGIVFYQAGKSEIFGGIETDQPGVLMVRREKDGLSVSVSDPTQKLDQIQLTLKGNYQTAHPSVKVTHEQNNSMLWIRLPKGDEAGKTVAIKLIKKK